MLKLRVSMELGVWISKESNFCFLMMGRRGFSVGCTFLAVVRVGGCLCCRGAGCLSSGSVWKFTMWVVGVLYITFLVMWRGR